MSEEAVIRRRQRDHERYMRNRAERLERQRAYYAANRDVLLGKVRLRRLGLYEKPVVSEEQRQLALERKRARDREYQRRRKMLMLKTANDGGAS